MMKKNGRDEEQRDNRGRIERDFWLVFFFYPV
jgi:hypothetical protein